MRSIDESFYRSKAWKQCRAQYIKKADGLCERCKAAGRIVPGKFVHHKIYMNEQTLKDPSLHLGDSGDQISGPCLHASSPLRSDPVFCLYSTT